MAWAIWPAAVILLHPRSRVSQQTTSRIPAAVSRTYAPPVRTPCTHTANTSFAPVIDFAEVERRALGEMRMQEIIKDTVVDARDRRALSDLVAGRVNPRVAKLRRNLKARLIREGYVRS